MAAVSKRERTHQRLLECALSLFETQGFEATTATQIAAAAGVSEMTFFRHFTSKERVITMDPYDPTIADGIAGQPVELPPLVRAVHGVRRALQSMSEPETDLVRRRVRILASSPSLRASAVRSNSTTEARIRDQLIADGVPALEAGVAAASLLAGLTAGLFAWSEDERLSLRGAIDGALDTLVGSACSRWRHDG